MFLGSEVHSSKLNYVKRLLSKDFLNEVLENRSEAFGNAEPFPVLACHETNMDRSLESQLEKVYKPLSEIDLTVEVKGVFALPETWKADSDNQDLHYQVTVAGVVFSNGRVRKRELTEEEVRQAEEAKSRKKDAGKKKPEEPTPEELEEQQRIQALKEEEEARVKAEWDLLDEETKFYRTMEDLYQHPCVVWEQEDEEDQRLVKSYEITQHKEDRELVDFEESVLGAGGVHIEVARLPKTDEESKKKAKKAHEEVKSSYCQAWLDLSELKKPFVSEVELRSKLQSEEEADLQDCYVLVKLKVNPPVVQTPEKPPKQPHDLIPQLPPVPKFRPSKDGTEDFNRQIKLAVKAIAAEFHAMYSDQLSQNEKQLPYSKQKELVEARKEDFLQEFNYSGKAQVLKNKLRKSIVKIAKEKFTREGGLKGLKYDETDKLFSEVYSYLVKEMQKSFKEVVKEKKRTLKEKLSLPEEVAEKEKETLVTELTEESFDSRLARLAREYEMCGNLEVAESYLKRRTQKLSRSPEAWLELSKFALRKGDLEQAEESLNKVVGLSEPDSAEVFLLMGAILLQKNKFEEASVFLSSYINLEPKSIPGNLLMSLLFGFLGHEKLHNKYSALAQKAFSAQKEELESAQQELSQESNPESFEFMYFLLVEYLFDQRLVGLAETVVEKFLNKTEPNLKLLQIKAEIEYFKENYQECKATLNQVLEIEPRDSKAWFLLGNAMQKLGDSPEAEESYIKALRYLKA